MFVEKGEFPRPGMDDELGSPPLPPPNPPPAIDGAVVENIVARNGFAAPAAPVICGRRPLPTVLPPKPLNAPVG